MRSKKFFMRSQSTLDILLAILQPDIAYYVEKLNNSNRKNYFHLRNYDWNNRSRS